MLDFNLDLLQVLLVDFTNFGSLDSASADESSPL